ncbi:MAG: cytochrome c biogenesis protein ResB [Bdellovibrionales bacterium]|nr:cytochrome c biogenesis protein ResB [Bdellovibrionales bacterium]
MGALRVLFRVFKSLQLAVGVIVMLAASLAAGTFLESYYDTPTAKFLVYDSWWFSLISGLLAANIAVVALSRWPWKRHHTAFLLAHAGILLMIGGSALTTYFGIDGTMVVSEGEVSNAVEFQDSVLYLAENERVDRVRIPWLPPNRRFSAIEVPGYSLLISKYLSHASPDVRFTPASGKGAPAVRLLLKGGPMQLRQEIWLWAGEPSWAVTDFGPASFSLLYSSPPALKKGSGGPKGKASMRLYVSPDGTLHYRTRSMRGEASGGSVSRGKESMHEIDPGWRGLTVKILEFLPRAENATGYVPARIQYGPQAPGPAIYVTVPGGGPGMWLGLGDRGTLALPGRDVLMSFGPRRVILPFGIQLNQFTIEHYEGTRNPSSYASKVQLAEEGKESDPFMISMNEPLTHGGFTFYQASYVPAEPRPVTSVFSVNRDPGRWVKYLGAILIVLGSILLFHRRIQQTRKTRGAKSASVTEERPL